MKIAKWITIIVFIGTLVIWGYGQEQVRKKDRIPPVITADADVLHIEASVGNDKLLQGMQAMDDVDGDLTSQILIGTVSPFKEKGVSTVEYVVFDSSNNVGRYERTVYFDHYESPRFYLSKPLVYEVNGTINITDRLTAEDMMEGDISDKIRFSSANLNLSEEGTYRLKIEVKNAYGDTVKYQLPMNLVRYDCETECIQLDTYLVYVKAGDSLQPESYIKTVTNRMGQTVGKDSVSITQDVDLSKPGTGQICYELLEEDEVVSATFLTVIVTD